jgi:putative ABC transport system ATP-binding protein
MLLFETRALCKYYRAGTKAEVRALDDVSLTIERGSLTVVTGASGSGKTTLLALLGGLERATRGEVYFDGKSLADCSGNELARLRRRVGFVFQDFALIPNLSVAENITYPLIPRGIPRADRHRRARELLARLGIEDKFASPARDLSGGERQRAGVARALAGDPEALLADEPTSNLDPATADAMLALIQERHAAGTTVVLSSHDPRVIAVATRRYDLAAGRLRSAP